MPYALILKWFLGGGWIKCLEGLAVIALVAWGAMWLHNYHAMQAKAAKADQLQGQLTDEHARLDVALAAKRQAETDRDLARHLLVMSDQDRNAFFDALRKGMKNAPVVVNPLCWPSDADRSVRNDAREKYAPGFGTVGTGSSLSAVP